MGKNTAAVTFDRDIREIFFGEASEPLTDQLVEELAARGWPKADLQKFQRAGWRYNRRRDSLLSWEVTQS